MSLHYLVKYLCSRNRNAQEVIEANGLVRLSNSKKTLRKICLVKCLMFNSVTKDVHVGHIKNLIIDCTPLV